MKFRLNLRCPYVVAAAVCLAANPVHLDSCTHRKAPLEFMASVLFTSVLRAVT